MPKDERLATRLVLEKKGHPAVGDLQQLEASGVSPAQAYDIVCLSAIKTITN